MIWFEKWKQVFWECFPNWLISEYERIDCSVPQITQTGDEGTAASSNSWFTRPAGCIRWCTPACLDSSKVTSKCKIGCIDFARKHVWNSTKTEGTGIYYLFITYFYGKQLWRYRAFKSQITLSIWCIYNTCMCLSEKFIIHSAFCFQTIVADKTNFLSVPVLPDSDVTVIVDKWLLSRQRALTSSQRTKLLASFQRCPLPLFLKLSFDEASLWKSYSPESITVLQTTVRESILHMFTKIETLHGNTLVSRALGYLTISKMNIFFFVVDKMLRFSNTYK